MADLLTIETFLPHAGKNVQFKGTSHILVLDRVEGEPGPPPPGYARAPFMVIFSGPRGAEHLPSGLYDCEIEGGPTVNLHVSPIHTDRPDRQEYQAAFN